MQRLALTYLCLFFSCCSETLVGSQAVLDQGHVHFQYRPIFRFRPIFIHVMAKSKKLTAFYIFNVIVHYPIPCNISSIG